MNLLETVFGWQTPDRRKIDLIFEAKGDGNLLTLGAFREMLAMHDIIFNNVHAVQDLEMNERGELVQVGTGASSAFKDICQRHTARSNQFNWKTNSVDRDVSITICLFSTKANLS